ncbi:uncharacterized protein [Parasteatoda tepidariorum]|uniref:uncharacterized protein isoform X2 n=1 Tax=Parasteatoda tepidariorum TaxID=114398 RepID=UPI0039BCEE50
MEELFNSYKKIVYRAVAVGLISEEKKIDYLSIMQDRPLREANISRTEKKTSVVTPVKYCFLSPEKKANDEPLNTSGICGTFKKLNANGSDGSYVILTETSPTEEKRGCDSSNLITMPKIKETINKNSPLLISILTGSENNINSSFDSKNSTHVLMAAMDKQLCNYRIDFGVPIYMDVVTKKYSKRKSCKKRGARALNHGKNERKPRRIYEESENMETDYDSFLKINENNSYFKNTLSHRQHILGNTSSIEINSKKSTSSDRFRFVKENDHFLRKYSDNELEDKDGAKTGEAETVTRKLGLRLEKAFRLKNKEFELRRMVQDLETLEIDDDCLPKANAKNKNFKRALILKQRKSRDASLLRCNFRKPSIIENLDRPDADTVPSSKRIERRRNFKKTSNPKQHKLRKAQFVERGFRKYLDFNSPALGMENNEFLKEGYSDDNSDYELVIKEGQKTVRQVLKCRKKSKAPTKMHEFHPLRDNENRFRDENAADKKARNSSSQMFCSKLLHNLNEIDKVVNIKILYQFFPREISKVCNDEEETDENKMGPESKRVEKKENQKKAARYLSRFFRKQS